MTKVTKVTNACGRKGGQRVSGTEKCFGKPTNSTCRIAYYYYYYFYYFYYCIRDRIVRWQTNQKHVQDSLLLLLLLY